MNPLEYMLYLGQKIPFTRKIIEEKIYKRELKQQTTLGLDDIVALLETFHSERGINDKLYFDGTETALPVVLNEVRRFYQNYYPTPMDQLDWRERGDAIIFTATHQVYSGKNTSNPQVEVHYIDIDYDRHYKSDFLKIQYVQIRERNPTNVEK